MTAFRSLSVAMLKGFFREKMALFFTFLFPLMFLVVFGLLFGGGGSGRITIAVVGDGPVITALGQTGAFDVRRVGTLDAAVAQVRSGDVPAAVAENGNAITLRFAQSDQVQAGTVTGIVSGVVDRVNIAATGQSPRLALDAGKVEDSSLKPIQYLTPGILSWGVATSAAFGTASTLVSWRRKQVLRRLRLAPVGTVTVLSSRLLVAVGIGVLQAILFVAVAMTPAFGLKLAGQWWLALPVLVSGILAFFALGMLIGSFTKSEEAATGLANIIVLPMSFLSGTFFNIQAAPAWLRSISNLLPLRHMNDAMLDVLVRGKGAEAIGVPVAILLGFTLVVGGIAARAFRWEPG